jgi:hypothetical protein
MVSSNIIGFTRSCFVILEAIAVRKLSVLICQLMKNMGIEFGASGH